ncbi:Uu.00g132270.m01.CDS01 [Anthostomella pinea]|uniref:Carbonic anhydrase n=1 Tax=Anthostomella pinea TaxID=933095 RepID=A0AAI8YFY0_9PEZI|nr:Uu.00g132270.m01.CDS01 [Anthostomella pinea]
MPSDVQKNLQEKNAAYAKQFTQGSLALPPAKKYLILTCMDARIDPAAAFGIDLGDAHVIRNAGGSARDAHRSIIISQQLLGTKEILLIKHTDCGMLTFSNEDAHGLVVKNLGPTAAAEIASLNFHAFPDLEAAVKEDVETLKKGATVAADVPISGWIYDVKTGEVSQVV